MAKRPVFRSDSEGGAARPLWIPTGESGVLRPAWKDEEADCDACCEGDINPPPPGEPIPFCGCLVQSAHLTIAGLVNYDQPTEPGGGCNGQPIHHEWGNLNGSYTTHILNSSLQWEFILGGGAGWRGTCDDPGIRIHKSCTPSSAFVRRIIVDASGCGFVNNVFALAWPFNPPPSSPDCRPGLVEFSISLGSLDTGGPLTCGNTVTGTVAVRQGPQLFVPNNIGTFSFRLNGTPL